MVNKYESNCANKIKIGEPLANKILRLGRPPRHFRAAAEIGQKINCLLTVTNEFIKYKLNSWQGAWDGVRRFYFKKLFFL